MTQRTLGLLVTLKSLQKTRLAHFLAHGDWPESLPITPEGQPSLAVREVVIGERGEFQVKLTEEFGQNKLIRYIPNTSQKGLVTWFCQTNLPNRWLGRGKERACIYNAALGSAVES